MYTCVAGKQGQGGQEGAVGGAGGKTGVGNTLAWRVHRASRAAKHARLGVQVGGVTGSPGERGAEPQGVTGKRVPVGSYAPAL